jgi:tRNA A-37 threonylcarbamoyl transferase component Bud32/tetratricopeptide (TPR) repeat protein
LSNLQDHVARHLSGTYTLERELGGGGMSRVFVAEETALGRKVVVKVMSPELAEGLSAERFVREIKVAARLQQANIVPVLRAGELDGLPYYTMPFVADESLRARMTDGTLKTTDAIGILRDVARALAYAHTEGVVHRDIKPENVLLSAGTAVVTDFGIAKAISDSRRDGNAGVTLTSVGTSLGTPAYMAPEQAAGDPSTDARADLYAWGVMAYELLAGRHPFERHRSPHDLIRAHMAEEPEHLAVRSTGVPVAVTDLVMRCLAKVPDARPSSAAELVTVFDEVRTTADVAPAPPVASGLLRALGIYAVALLVVGAIAKAAISVIGLPTWVFPGAVGVMIVGLPVVFLTALLERQRNLSRVTTPGSMGTLARIAARNPRQFTWRSTVLSGGVALGLFVAAVAGYMAMRQFGIGPFGTLIGSKALAVQDRIVIADMRGPASDSGLGDVFAEGLRAGLSESKALRLVSTDRVVRLQQQMERAGAALTGEVVRDVAARAGAKAILEGEVDKVGSSYALTVRLLPSSGGDPLVTLQETAANDADFTSATGRLAKRLRERVGESLRSVNAAPELPDVTTTSLPALRRYTEALRAERRGDYPAAFRLAREATEIDSGFASAYSFLGATLSAILGTRQAQSEMAERAYTMRERATPFERKVIERTYWWSGPHPNLDRMKDVADDMYALDPVRGASFVTEALYNLRDYEGALRAGHESIALDSSDFNPYWFMAMAYAELGQLDSARAAVDRYMALSQGHPGAVILTMQLATLMNQDSVALGIATQMRNMTANPLVVEWGAQIQSALLRRAGRLRESWEATKVAERMGTARGVAAARNASLFQQASDRAIFLDDVAGARRLLDSAIRRFPQESLPPLERYTDDFVMAAYHVGRTDLLKTVVDGLRRDDPDRMGIGGGSRMLAEAELFLALSERRYADAMEAVRRSDVGPQSKRSLVRLAKTFDAAGQADSALHYYERYVNSPSIDLTIWSEAQDLARARRQLGELYESRKEYTKAYEQYAALVNQWRDADPELQRIVRDVRARMAVLDRLRAQ